jgi:hypothetical protein
MCAPIRRFSSAAMQIVRAANLPLLKAAAVAHSSSRNKVATKVAALRAQLLEQAQ